MLEKLPKIPKNLKIFIFSQVSKLNRKTSIEKYFGTFSAKVMTYRPKTRLVILPYDMDLDVLRLYSVL